MKKLLAVIGVLLGAVLAEPEAPYPPSGFRPSGPAFELPQKATQQQQEYLPPVDPRRPAKTNTEYGIPEEDLSVQGLPETGQQPIFQVSPINGQLFMGPQFNNDLRNLDSTDSFRFNQYQLQQQKYRELERQRELEAAQARNRANQFPQVPRQFAQTTPGTTDTTRTTDDRTESTTEALELNEGETLQDKKDDNKKVTVEVTKQNIQEYPGELFLSSLAQLQLQPRFIPIQQFGQLKAPLQYQPVQDAQNQGYDASTHFAALPSVLAQRQTLQQQQGFQNPALFVASPDPSVAALIQAQQSYQPVNQYSPSQIYPQPIIVQQPQPNLQPQNENRQDQDQFYQQSYQPQEVVYQPQLPQPQSNHPQQSYQPQEVVYQPQFSPQPNQQEVVYQQRQFSQPQPNQAEQNLEVVYQPQLSQPNQQQNFFLPQARLVDPRLLQQYQNGYAQQQVYQNQDNLQSGINLNEGNDLDEQKVDDNDDGPATAVATAFGARTQPRVIPRYGAPIPRVAAIPQTTTEPAIQDEQATDNAGAVAEANAFAMGQKNPAKQSWM